MKERAWLELSKQALLENINILEESLKEQGKLAPVLKANAYGHGLTSIVEMLESYPTSQFTCKMYCVACIQEGITLRKSGVRKKILILGYTPLDQAPLLKQYDLIQAVVDAEYGRSLAHLGIPLEVHLKIDTGMHRLGFDPENFDAILNTIQYPNLHVSGIFTHFCNDEGKSKEQVLFTHHQEEQLQQVKKQLNERGYTNIRMHSLASYGTLFYSELESDYARCGIALYGLLSNRKDTLSLQRKLVPIASLKTRVTHVSMYPKDTSIGYGASSLDHACKIATLNIGYGDGVPRCLSNGKGYVLIANQKAPIVGNICMDQMMVDVTNISDVCMHDEVTLLSNQEGSMNVYDWAECAHTITNEIVTGFASRLERIIVE